MWEGVVGVVLMLDLRLSLVLAWTVDLDCHREIVCSACGGEYYAGRGL